MVVFGDVSVLMQAKDLGVWINGKGADIVNVYLVFPVRWSIVVTAGRKPGKKMRSIPLYLLLQA